MESSNKIGAGCALLVSFISVSISLFNIFHKETYTAELTDSKAIEIEKKAFIYDQRTQEVTEYDLLKHTEKIAQVVAEKKDILEFQLNEINSLELKENEDKKTVAAMDCLVPGIGEIMGGSQREDDYNKLLKRIEELGMKSEDYDFYLDLRKYGSTRHAGYGLGFERCVMYLTGMSNIRDVLPFPRTVGNCEL